MAKFLVDKIIFEKFPSLSIGVIIAKNVGNSGEIEDIEKKLNETCNSIREKYTSETLSQNGKIACWRAAYSAFGGEPKKNRSSIENLCRHALDGGGIRTINKLVDCYNLISMRYMLPAGGEDLDRTSGDIVLLFAEAGETPVLLLGEKEPRAPREGEVIYRDDISAICRRWNWREADRTKLTAETKNCILVVEGLHPTTREEIEIATKELAELVRKECGGELSTSIVDKNSPTVEM